MYGGETWNLRRTDEDNWKQQRCDFYCMYQVIYTLWDKERIDEIRSQLGMRKLDTQIHERKKNWLEHQQRMPSERASKQFIYYQPTGRRDPGKPRRR
jgi:hypothetical protein